MNSKLFDERTDMIENGSPTLKKKKGNPFLEPEKPRAAFDTLKLRHYLGLPDVELLSVRLSNDDSKVAGGYADGNVRVYQRDSGFHSYLEQLLTCFQGSSYYTPTTCLRFRPTKANKTTEALLSANSDGTIIQWSVTKGKQMAKINEKNHQILCLDYNEEGTNFATAGRDFKIRIYDEETKEIVIALQGDVYNNPGHSNRVFCVKYLPENPFLLMSGGWDDSVFFWDVRTGKSCGSLLGASISGDSLDYHRGQILTGSYRSSQQLQLWDFGMKKLVQDIPYNPDNPDSKAMIYGCQFNKMTGNEILAGSTGNNEVRIYQNDGEYKPFGIVSNLVKGCYSVDFGNKSKIFSFGGGDGVIYVIQQF